MADSPKLSKFSVEHCLKPDGFGVITSSQLHHFADASEIGYGSVSYLRLVNARNEAHCSFLCAKSSVAPLKMITIPRLELSAAVTAVKQDRLLKRQLEISVNARSVFWTVPQFCATSRMKQTGTTPLLPIGWRLFVTGPSLFSGFMSMAIITLLMTPRVVCRQISSFVKVVD